jgi:hypothetical protein
MDPEPPPPLTNASAAAYGDGLRVVVRTDDEVGVTRTADLLPVRTW